MDGDKRRSDEAEKAGWHYASGDRAAGSGENTKLRPGTSSRAGADTVEWSASEFVAHEKGLGWYGFLAAAAVAVAVVLYLITHDILGVVVVMIMAITFGVAGARKPKVIEYRLDNTGLAAAGKFYPYNEYKAFAMPEQGPFASIVLVPLKRFGLPVSAYLAPDSQQKVVTLLSEHLPMERGQLDGVERLMRRLRF